MTVFDVRVCLDLNVLVANFISLGSPRPTAVKMLVDTVRTGRWGEAPAAIVISAKMLSDLETVLARSFPADTARAAATDIASISMSARSSSGPLLVLGGGYVAMQDGEDIGVFETAIAGRADILVTANIADFMRGPRANIDTQVFLYKDDMPVGLVFHRSVAGNPLFIVTPQVAAEWRRSGVLPFRQEVETYYGRVLPRALGGT